MSTTTAMAGIAAANANIAAANARAAHVSACKAMVPGYQHDAATTQARQEYAECVRTLHPVEYEADEIVVAKVAVALLIASVFGGAGVGWFTGFGGWCESLVFGAVLGLLAMTGGQMLLAGLYFGIKFLMS